MERQQSFKLERKSSLEAEPRTMSKRDYELAFAALKAYMQGNVEVDSPASAKNEKEKAPVTVQQKGGKAAAAPKSTKEAGSSSGSGSGSGSDIKLPALA